MNELAQNAVYSKRYLCATQFTTALVTKTMKNGLTCLLAHKYCSYTNTNRDSVSYDI